MFRSYHRLTSVPNGEFQLPALFDLGATFAFALTGALAAIRRGYDIVGVFFLALASGLGGGLIRDGVFIQGGTTPLLTPKQLQALGVCCVSYARMLTSAALKGMMNALDAFAPMIDADTVTPRSELQVTFPELNKLMGIEQLDELEERFK